MAMSGDGEPEYTLGHSDHEINRLERQGDYFRDLTRDLFVRAGLQKGMRVLDYGGGAGDVAILAAELVGPSGAVVSFDRSPEAVSKARERAAACGLQSVRFLQADEETVRDLLGPERFDAVVGRLVLVFQSHPEIALQKLMSYLHPRGIIAFHEYDQEGGCWSQPRLPLLEQLVAWVIETFRRGGMLTDAGRVLQHFHKAGIESIRIVREGQVTDGANPLAYQFLIDIMRTILPLAEKTGVTTAQQVQLESLLDRLKEESQGKGAHWIPAFLVAAWGRARG
ncbi:MAG TPA: class I SAM-dependent methyltransferase [Candidatus Angelobacter sp.]